MVDTETSKIIVLHLNNHARKNSELECGLRKDPDSEIIQAVLDKSFDVVGNSIGMFTGRAYTEQNSEKIYHGPELDIIRLRNASLVYCSPSYTSLDNALKHLPKKYHFFQGIQRPDYSRQSLEIKHLDHTGRYQERDIKAQELIALMTPSPLRENYFEIAVPRDVVECVDEIE